MRVQVCIPHYFCEHIDPNDNVNGYGSLRHGSRLARSIALSRCISALIDLRRYPEICILNINDQTIDHFKNIKEPLEININIYTDGINMLNDVLRLYKGHITVNTASIDNPRELPLVCRDMLIKSHKEFDLLSYLEDDIIIKDNFFYDKINWFLDKTSHRYCLMPHRYEIISKNTMESLIIDGPNSQAELPIHRKNVAQGKFRGVEDVLFDLADNPHSGTFTISSVQAKELDLKPLPREGFIGPLETAATFTVLHRFPIIKPSRKNWKFLCIEHGHPSFLHHINSLPHRNVAN